MKQLILYLKFENAALGEILIVEFSDFLLGELMNFAGLKWKEN
jgi:hypothetical protein